MSDKDLLLLSQPLLNVHVGSGSEKFGGDGRMIDKEVADFFLARVGFQMNLTAQAFSRKDDPLRNELNFSPVLCSLIPLFTFLAPGLGQPLEGEEDECEAMEHYDRLSVESLRDDSSVGDFSVWSYAAQITSDFDQSGHQASEDVTSGLDLSGSFATHEDKKVLRRGEAVDFRVYGFDHSLRELITLGVLDGKGLNSWPDYVPQILYYGCAGACQNIRAGRMNKVPCIAIGIGWWASAEIDPIGYVQVTGSNNRVSKASVIAFRTHVVKKCQLLQSQGKLSEARNLQADYLDKSVEELVAAFATQVRDRTRKAATNINERSFQQVENICTPTFKKAANLIVGTATYSTRSCAMLRYPLAPDARVAQDDRTFISGMTRMMYGDRVLKWGLNAVMKHSRDRQQAQHAFLRSVSNCEIKDKYGLTCSILGGSKALQV